MTSPIYFDDSLPIFASLVLKEWGAQALVENFFLRDVSGRLTFVVLQSERSADERISLASNAVAVLGSYVDGDGFAVATPDELFDERLKDQSQARKIRLNHCAFAEEVYLVDRRMVGADWLRDPAPTASPPIRLVFASLKAGVGRSTALCVLAAHLALQGRRVLAIDMDLEAPGLGNMLLPGGTLPKFGLLDYFVEQSYNSIDEQFYADMVGPSWLGGGRGRVDVIPAIGQNSLNNPANVLAKIARAYLSTPSSGYELSSFADHMSQLLDRVAEPSRYDVILIDARAGLHETTASAIVGLGAEVLFFGIDQPQTFAGYELLLAHLATLQVNVNDDWRSRLQFVQAKAPNSIEKRNEFSQKVDLLLRKYFLPLVSLDNEIVDISTLKDVFEVDWSEEDGAGEILVENESILAASIAILDDDRFHTFDPIANRDLLAERTYIATFGDLLEVVIGMIDAAISGSES